MATVRLFVCASNAMIAGKDRPYGLTVITVSPADFTCRQRVTLARFAARPYADAEPRERPTWYPGPDADFHLDGESRYTNTGSRPYRDLCHSLTEATLDQLRGLLDAIAAMDAREAELEAAKVAREAAVREARIMEDLAKPVEAFICRSGSYIGSERHAQGSYAWSAHGLSFADSRIEAKLIEARALARLRNEAETDERRRKVESEAAERAGWIHQHGSPRLQRLAAEGIGHEKTYQRERAAYGAAFFAALLAEKRPGWAACTGAPCYEQVSDCSDRTLAVLDAARKLAPSARLAKLDGKYVCVETFEGQLIVWPRD